MFSTEESAQYSGIWSVKGRSGGLEPFSRDKLLMSLYRSCQHRPNALMDAGGLTDTVIKKVAAHVKNGGVGCQDIAQIAQVSLNRFDKAASVHYQAFHRH